MELKFGDKELQVKFNFASLSLWEEKIVDGDGKKTVKSSTHYSPD